jgi:chemotaxis protein methyltransferase CheR
MSEPLIQARVEISDEELQSLTNAIKLRYGIDFTNYERKSLKRGFARVISKHNLGSLLGLWSKVLKDREFILGMVDDLMVNLTEMFRNPEIWVTIRQKLLNNPQYQKGIDIWHAGCSTGEEIYTMAFVLNDAALLDKSKVLATDLSATALEKAKAGTYPEVIFKKYLASFKGNFPNVDINRYFEISAECSTVKPAFRSHISFQRHNLVQDAMPRKFDIIFCRNVMIYFDDALKMKVLSLIHSALKPDGFFIIGYYDMLPEKSKELFALYDPVTRIYRKKMPVQK